MSRPWMPLYVADYLADTGHLSTAEHGAYMLLIMHYWSKGCLPNDDRRLASIARASLEQWSGMRDTIAEFFGDEWKHPRIDAEIESAKKAYERRALAGRAGGKAKAAANQSSSIATALPQQSYSQPQKVKEEPNGSSKTRGTRLPDSWSADLEFAHSVGLSEGDARNEATKFREWWPAQPGQRGVKVDWDLTWKTWCRKAASDRRQPYRATAPPKGKTVGEIFRDDAKRMGIIPNDQPSAPPERLDSGNRDGQDGGTGITRRFTLPANVVGRFG